MVKNWIKKRKEVGVHKNWVILLITSAKLVLQAIHLSCWNLVWDIYIYICMYVCMYVCIKKQMHYFEVFCLCMLPLIRNLITPFKCHNHADVSLDSYTTGKLLCAKWHLPPQLWIISFFFFFFSHWIIMILLKQRRRDSPISIHSLQTQRVKEMDNCLINIVCLEG